MAQNSPGGFARWMALRNGSDQLGVLVLVVSYLLSGANVFVGTPWLSAAAFACAAYALFRYTSTNVAARRQENDALFHPKAARSSRAEATSAGAASHLRPPEEPGERFSYDQPLEAVEPPQPEYVLLDCPHCQRRMRVPVGVGMIRVTCPTCHEQFEART